MDINEFNNPTFKNENSQTNEICFKNESNNIN